MTAKIVPVYLLGCLTGAAAVGLWMHLAAPALTPSAPTTGESRAARAPDPSGRIHSKPATTMAVTAAPVPKAESSKIDHSSSAPPVEAPSADAAPAAYDFSAVTNSERKMEQIFQSERFDPVWSSQTVDSLNLLLSQMPERSVIGEYGLTCKESLCKLEIHGTNAQLAPNRAENNPQLALMRMFGEPPGNEIFDDSTMHVEAGKNDDAKIVIYAHRRRRD